eukprot:2790542-Ditylum_brightwellii.AAC.1
MRKHHATPKKNFYKSPPYKKMFESPPPVPISDFSSVASSISRCDILQDYGVSNPESFILQDGTKSNPIVTFVNSVFPERNGGMCGCGITLVQGIEYNSYSRDAYKICL